MAAATRPVVAAGAHCVVVVTTVTPLLAVKTSLALSLAAVCVSAGDREALVGEVCRELQRLEAAGVEVAVSIARRRAFYVTHLFIQCARNVLSCSRH